MSDIDRKNYRENRPFNESLAKQTTDYWAGNRDPRLDPEDPQAAYAVYLPATSSNYVVYSHRQKVEEFGMKSAGYDKGHRLPASCHPDGDELNFYQKDSGSFFYGAGLYSSGHATLDIEKSKSRESFVHERDPSVTMVGDSGGFQWATGTWKTDWSNQASIEKVRSTVLNWLEYTADYAMILDMPTAAISRNKDWDTIYNMMKHRYSNTGPYKPTQACLDFTLENADYFIRNRTEGAVKFLNVLQGRSVSEADAWFDAVKHLPFEGWAFAGKNAIDFEMICRRLIVLRDENLLDAARHWVHILGVSRIGSAAPLTQIQRILRKQVDPKITISFDSSSPYLATANGLSYTRNVFNNKRFTFIMDSCVDDKDLTGSNTPLCDWLQETYGSTPEDLTWASRNLTVGDICTKGHDKESSSSWDTVSYILIMNHNTEMQLKAIQTGNRIYEGSEPAFTTVQDGLFTHEEKRILPGLEFMREIVLPEIFESEKPMDTIKKYKTFLTGRDKVHGTINGTKTGLSFSDDTFSENFE